MQTKKCGLLLLILALQLCVAADASAYDPAGEFLLSELSRIYASAPPGYKYMFDLDAESVVNVEKSISQIFSSSMYKAITEAIKKTNVMTRKYNYEKYQAQSINSKPFPGNRFFIACSLVHTTHSMSGHLTGEENACTSNFPRTPNSYSCLHAQGARKQNASTFQTT